MRCEICGLNMKEITRVKTVGRLIHTRREIETTEYECEVCGGDIDQLYQSIQDTVEYLMLSGYEDLTMYDIVDEIGYTEHLDEFVYMAIQELGYPKKIEWES